MNIVSMAMQYLTPMLIDRLASSLGIQSPMVKTAIAAILPSILAGLTGVAARPGGGKQITDVLGKQSPNILGDLGSIFGGGDKQAQAAKGGADVLREMLGGGAMSGLTSAVGKFSGAGEGGVQSLLGLMAPVALGTLAKQQKDSGLDAAGLANLLIGQKENIAAAMPAGFSDLLKGTGLLAAIAPAKAAAAPAATPSPAATPRPAATPSPSPAAAPRPAATVHPMPTPAKPAGGLGMWPMVLAAVALAIGGWYYFNQSKPQLAFPAVPEIKLGGQNLGAELGSVAEGLRGTLTGLKDEASAKAALPRLQQMAQQLGGINDTAAKLPADGRRSLAAYAAQLLPLLRPLIDRALAASGVGAVAKPVLDQILNRLEAMAKA